MCMRNQICFHESGHAVFAAYFGLVVGDVRISGDEGSTDFSLSNDILLIINGIRTTHFYDQQQKFTALSEIFSISRNYFVSLLGGIAADGLINNNVMIGARRAADDIATFFCFLETITPFLTHPEKSQQITDFFVECLDHAQRLAAEKKDMITAVANKLDASGCLSSAELAEILQT